MVMMWCVDCSVLVTSYWVCGHQNLLSPQESDITGHNFIVLLSCWLAVSGTQCRWGHTCELLCVAVGVTGGPGVVGILFCLVKLLVDNTKITLSPCRIGLLQTTSWICGANMPSLPPSLPPSLSLSL